MSSIDRAKSRNSSSQSGSYSQVDDSSNSFQAENDQAVEGGEVEVNNMFDMEDGEDKLNQNKKKKNRRQTQKSP